MCFYLDTIMEAEIQRRGSLFSILTQEMKLKNYSLKTIKAYKSCIRSFVQYIAPKHPRKVDNEVRKYLLHLLTEKKSPASTFNQVFNALRLLYFDLYHKPFVIGSLPRPQKEQKLPDVLNEEEVMRLFCAVENLKHRTMLMLTYASSFRVS